MTLRHDDEKELIKAAFKEAAREWLDNKFAEFGKWSAMAIAAAALVALIYFILKLNGWNHSATFHRAVGQALAMAKTQHK
jgi:hypothetical protein